MIERDEPPKVLLKLHGERILHEVRLMEFQTTLKLDGTVAYFHAVYEIRAGGNSCIVDSSEVDTEYILTEYKV